MTTATAQAKRGLGGEHHELRLYEVNRRFQHVADARKLSVGIKGLTIRATLRIAAQSLPRYPRYAGAAMGPMTKLDEGQRDGIKDDNVPTMPPTVHPK